MAKQGKKIILGLTGLLSSGKGTAAKYLEKKYGASTYRFSTMLRDILNRLYLKQTRDNMVRLSEMIRSTFGEDTLAKTIAKDAEINKNQIIVVDGIRRPADISYLSNMPNFVLAEIFAAPKIRYGRLILRGENIDDNKKTYKEFLADHQRSTELSILEVIKDAKEKIDNNGDLKSLYARLDNLVAKYSA